MSSPDQPDAADPRPATPRRDAPLARGVRGATWNTLREFVVIVAGVLAALAAQAWWEARQERQLERDYLHQLLMDTQENERRLESAVRSDSITNVAIRRLVEAFTASGPLPPSDSLVRWTLRAGATSEFQPLAGAYEALLGTGDIRMIRNDSLRVRLVAYGGRLHQDREMLTVMLQMSLSKVDVFPRKVPFFRRIFLDDLDTALTTPFQFEPLRDDPEFAGALFLFHAANTNRLTRLRRMREETQAVRRALQAESRLLEPGR